MVALTSVAMPASAQTGTVKGALKEDQAKIKWESADAVPVAGRLGMVVDGDHNLAIFRVLLSKGRESTVQILDSIWPDVVMRDEGAQLLDDLPEPTPPDKATFFIWSGRPGRSVILDGHPAGRTPTQLLLSPGSHQILVELPTGGKAGAMVEASPGESEFLLLSGKIPPAPNGMGPAYLNHRSERSLRKPVDRPRHLLWLEDNQGVRIYLPCEPVTAPTVKTKVKPHYPEFDRQHRIEGRVWLYALVGADGRPIQVEAIAEPSPSLASAAKDAVDQWMYEPATLDGKPVPALILFRVEFMLMR